MANTKNAAVQLSADTQKLPWWFAPAWSTRAASLGLNVVLIMQLTYYCTDLLGMSAGLVGGLLLASKLFDGFTDLIVGFIIDKTNTRLGKARPYEFCILFVWIFTVLLFSVPDMAVGLQSAWIFVFYTLINSVCATFLNGTDAVYLARSVRKTNDQIKVMSINGMIVMFLSIVISIIMPQLVAGIGVAKSGWTTIALMFAIPLGLIGMGRFLFIKELDAKDAPKQQTKIDASASVSANPLTLKASLKAVAANKYVFIIAGATLLVNIINNLGTATTYYFKYIMGNIGLASIASMTSIVTPLLLILYPLAARKLGSTKLLRLGAVLGIVGLLIRTLGGANLATIVVGGLIAGIGVMPITMMISIFLIECMDYGEWKTGVRVEGALGSVNSFASKVGSGLASALTGIIMGAAGYNGSLAVQSASATTAIVAVYNWLPLVLYVGVLVLALLYNVDKHLPQIRNELAQRHNV